jgi:hypothetical protein
MSPETNLPSRNMKRTFSQECLLANELQTVGTHVLIAFKWQRRNKKSTFGAKVNKLFTSEIYQESLLGRAFVPYRHFQPIQMFVNTQVAYPRVDQLKGRLTNIRIG